MTLPKTNKRKGGVLRYTLAVSVLVISMTNIFYYFHLAQLKIYNRLLPSESEKYKCPPIDRSKRQIIMLIIGSVRSFVYPIVHENYQRNIVQAIQDRSNAQVHQIWYFTLSDASRWAGRNSVLSEGRFPGTNISHLQHLQQRYRVPVLELYNASVSYPEDFEDNPFNRNCTDFKLHRGGYAIYAQPYHLQSAFQVVSSYANECNVDWSYLIKSRPDIICTRPVMWNLTEYALNTPEQHIIFDDSWGHKIADYAFAMNKHAAQTLFPNYLDNYITIPCNATNNGANSESLLKAMLLHRMIELVPSRLDMCGIGRRNCIEFFPSSPRCQQDEEYSASVNRSMT